MVTKTPPGVSKATKNIPAPSTPPPSGMTGLKRVSGLVYEEFHPKLQGEFARRIFKEMSDNDPIIGAELFAIDMFMRRVKWFVDPAGDSTEDEDKAEFLRECKDDMSHTWADLISEINSMLIFGWSFFEILYKRRLIDEDDKGNSKSKHNDGKIGWRKFEIRSQDSFDRWDFDEEGGLAGMYQRPAPDYEEKYIPIQKALLFRTTSRKNNPEGRSVLRNAYRPWYFKKRIEEIEGIGVERDLAGLPFAEVPAEALAENATEKDKAMVAKVVELVKNVRRDEQEGVVWPQSYDDKGNKQYEFRLLNSGGTRQFSTDQIITRYEQRMAMTVLADFILLGNESQGSFAMATSKSGMFQASLEAWLDNITSVLNNYAVPRLFRLNGFKEGPYPQFRHDDVQKPSLADLATFVSALVGAGATLFPDTQLENFLRKLALLPERKEGEGRESTEEELRTEQLSAQIEQARATQEMAKNPPQPQVQPAIRPPGKQPGTRPGAPTKTTGPVKSKLPPQQRRRTAAVAASENVRKKIRVSRRTLEAVYGRAG